jgi:multiple sugar transport system substrate-binding protein
MPKLTRRRLNAAALAALAVAKVQGARTAAADVTSGLPRTYAGTSLRIMAGSDPVSMYLASYSRAFSDATGIALEFGYSGSNDRYQRMVLDVTSGGQSFDVYQFAYQWKYEVAPYLADLTHLESEIAGAPPLDLDDYPKRALDVYGRLGDKLIALPLLGSTTFLVWNKKAYAAAGLDPNTPPVDWQGVVENGKKLMSGKQYGFNLPAGKADQCMCTWIVLFHSFGGRYFDDKGQPMFDSEPAVKAMSFMANDLHAISPPDDLTWDFPEMVTSFATGQSAQGFMWPGGFSTIRDPAKSVVSGDAAGMRPTPGAVLLGGWALGVNAKSQHIAAAKLFSAWLTSKAVVHQTAAMSGQPCRISAFTEPALVAKFPQYPVVLAALEGPVVQFVPIKEAQQVHIMIFNQANAACAKTKMPEQAAKDLQRQVVAFMKRRGYLHA